MAEAGAPRRIAVIGAKGMLGREMVRVLGRSHEVIGWDIEEIDITEREAAAAALAAVRPELIVNCAALVDVEACEADPDTAWRVNAVGSQNLALAAARSGGEYLYFSSDYVFDGESGGDYDELSPPAPVNQYGRSKLAGEVLARRVCPRVYIVRTAWLFGHREGNYVERVLRAAERDGVVRMAADQIESPTYTGHLAEAVAALIATGAYGTYHATSRGSCTRAEFAEFVLRSAGRGEPVETVEAERLTRKAPRPARTVLDCRLLRLVTGRSLPAWQQGVLDYLERPPA